MRRIVLAVAVLTVCVALAGCSSSGTSTSGAQNGTAINIQDSTFTPAQLQTPVGAQVSWANNDSVPHQIVADDGSFDSGPLAENRAFRHTFATAGTYAYHCALHANETGSIIAK